MEIPTLCDPTEPQFHDVLFIGRPSIYGNPFKIGRDGSREVVIQKYKAYFWKRLNEDAHFLSAVRALEGKRLKCFCTPKPCHGDVIIAWFRAGCPLKEK